MKWSRVVQFTSSGAHPERKQENVVLPSLVSLCMHAEQQRLPAAQDKENPVRLFATESIILWFFGFGRFIKPIRALHTNALLISLNSLKNYM